MDRPKCEKLIGHRRPRLPQLQPESGLGAVDWGHIAMSMAMSSIYRACSSAYTGIGSGKPAYQVFPVKIPVKISSGKPAYQISLQDSICMTNVQKIIKHGNLRLEKNYRITLTVSSTVKFNLP